MYSYIKGELTEQHTDYVVVEAGGIGYQIYTPMSEYSQIPYIGTQVKVYTYLYIREDAMVLYGFWNEDDLQMFKLLITVSGIGPKGGLAILSVMSSDDIRFAILAGDSKAISKAPGIGAKTAQRVILDLKDKMNLEEAFEKKLEKGNDSTKPSPSDASAKNDAVMALTALGYSGSESLRAVSAVEITPDMDVEDILKLALKHISNL